MIEIKDEELIQFYKDNLKLKNKDLYIKYLLTLCNTEIEKQIIKDILWKAMQNNSLIRIKNDLINQWILEDLNPERRNKQKEEVSNQYSSINNLLSRFTKYFNN